MQTSTASVQPARRVLSIGAGPRSGRGIHAFFRGKGWDEVRLDIDPRVKPDIVASVVDMQGHVADASFDALWCSHVLEHLFQHDATTTLGEILRILKPSGFALITCPDLERIAEAILDQRLHAPLYQSPAGPITPHDMLFGHQASVRKGNLFMRHNTGFTAQSMGQFLSDGGFEEVRVLRNGVDLWAVACRETLSPRLLNELAAAGLDFQSPASDQAPPRRRQAG